MDASQHSSSSRSANDYSSSLIGTVSELRMELQRTMAEVQTMKEQNRSLQSNNHALKEELLDARKKYTEAQENYMATVTEKLDMQRSSNNLVEKIRRQLSEKTKEFEAIRERSLPQDIDTIRIKVQEELEIPHREKIMRMQAEVQEQRNKYYAMKREMENWKTECETITRQHSRNETARKEEHEKVLKFLRDEISKLHEREIPQERDEKIIRQQVADIQELRHLTNKYKEDIEDMRKSRDDVQLALELSISKRDEVTTQTRVRIAMIEADKLTLEQQLHQANSEIDRKDAQIRNLTRQVEDLTSELELVKKTLEDTYHQLSTSTTEHTTAVGDLKSEFDVERSDYEAQVTQLQEKLYDREEMVRRAQRTATEMQVRAESVENDLRRENLVKLNELSKKLASTELQLAEEKKNATQTQIESKRAHEELSAEVEVTKSELARITREKDVLHEKVRDLETKLEGEKRAVLSIRRESDTITKNLQGTIKELKYKASDLQDKNSHEIKIEQELRDSLRVTQEKLDASQGELRRTIETLQRERQKELEDMARVYGEKARELKDNFKGELEKHKKRGDVYKKELEEMRKKGKILSNAALAAAASSYGGLPGVTGPSTEEFMALAASLPRTR